MPIPVQLIQAKIKRANKHILDLSTASHAFWNSAQNPIQFSDDFVTGMHTYYWDGSEDFLFDVSLTAGDAVHNLRSALDQLAYQLVRASGNSPDHKTGFPIAGDANKYRFDPFPGNVKGMSDEAIKAIDAVKPYKGGNDDLWRLHRLNIIDKHRLLLNICPTNTFYSVAPSDLRGEIRRWEDMYPGAPIPRAHSCNFWIGQINPLPLKKGDTLLTLRHSELEDEPAFRFDLAFNEPEVGDAKPVVETLQRFAELVSKIVSDFSPMLSYS